VINKIPTTHPKTIKIVPILELNIENAESAPDVKPSPTAVSSVEVEMA